MGDPLDMLRVSYEQVHTICKGIARELSASFRPDTLLAIGGGGYFPARVMRTFLPGTQIVAATLKLYNDTTHGISHDFI